MYAVVGIQGEKGGRENLSSKREAHPALPAPTL